VVICGYLWFIAVICGMRVRIYAPCAVCSQFVVAICINSLTFTLNYPSYASLLIMFFSFLSNTYRFGKDQSAAIAKLHALILELQNANNGRDEALIAAVEALVSFSLFIFCLLLIFWHCVDASTKFSLKSTHSWY